MIRQSASLRGCAFNAEASMRLGDIEDHDGTVILERLGPTIHNRLKYGHRGSSGCRVLHLSDGSTNSIDTEPAAVCCTPVGYAVGDENEALVGGHLPRCGREIQFTGWCAERW